MAKLIIEIDTRNAARGVKQLDSLLTNFGRKTDRATTKTKKLDRSFKGLSKSAALLGSAFSGAAIAYGLVQLTKIADTYTNINSRLKLVTNSTEELAKVQADLFAISQQTGTSFKNNAAAYAKLGLGLSSLNVSSKELLDISTLLNQSLIVSGAGAQEASSFMLQYTQALSSGVLAGEEFRAMVESNSYFATKLAIALGVTRGELRQMSRDQLLTTEVLRDAMKKMNEDVAKDFAKMPKTVARAMNELKNAFGSIIADTNNAEGATSSLAESIAEFATAITDNKAEIIGFFRDVLKLAKETGQAVINIAVSLKGWQAVGEGRLSLSDFALMNPAELKEWAAAYDTEKERINSRLKDLYENVDVWKTSRRNNKEKELAKFRKEIRDLENRRSEIVWDERAKALAKRVKAASDAEVAAGRTALGASFEAEAQASPGKMSDIPTYQMTDEDNAALAKYLDDLQYIKSITEANTTAAQRYNEESAKTYELVQKGLLSPEARQEYLKSLADDFDAAGEAASDYLQQVQTMGETVSGRLEDGFVQAFMAASTGAKNFGDIALDVLKSVAAEMFRMSVAKPAAGFASGLLTSFVSSLAGGAASGSGSTGSTSQFSASNSYWSNNAKGNAFSGAGISAYSGSVVDKPTNFFANGGNVMGEAGPEAILPLKRGPSGKLGIEANGSGGGQAQNVTVQIQAVDAKSFADLTKRNPGAIVGPILQAMQAGNQGLRSTMKTVVA